MNVLPPISIKLPDGFLNAEERCGFVVNSRQKRVFAVQLDLLEKFFEVCRKHDIRAVAFAGTLLGAVRHRGFIPWDDDADVCMDRANFEKLRALPRWIGAVILLLGVPFAYFTPYAMHSIRLNYESEGFSNLQGILLRILFYAAAFLMGAAIIQLMPARKTWLSGVGKASLIVYAGSTFLSPHAYLLVASALHLNSNRALNLIGMFLFSLVLILFFSNA